MKRRRAVGLIAFSATALMSGSAALAASGPLLCDGGYRFGSTPMGNVVPLGFKVDVTNPKSSVVYNVKGSRKGTVVANPHVIPAGARVAVTYSTGSRSSKVPARATAHFTLPNALDPGESARFSAPAWKGKCKASANW